MTNDSRITYPSKPEAKNLVYIEGGKNNTALAEFIDIKSPRRSQKKRL